MNQLQAIVQPRQNQQYLEKKADGVPPLPNLAQIGDAINNAGVHDLKYSDIDGTLAPYVGPAGYGALGALAGLGMGASRGGKAMALSGLGGAAGGALGVLGTKKLLEYATPNLLNGSMPTQGQGIALTAARLGIPLATALLGAYGGRKLSDATDSDKDQTRYKQASALEKIAHYGFQKRAADGATAESPSVMDTIATKATELKDKAVEGGKSLWSTLQPYLQNFIIRKDPTSKLGFSLNDDWYKSPYLYAGGALGLAGLMSALRSRDDEEEERGRRKYASATPVLDTLAAKLQHFRR